MSCQRQIRLWRFFCFGDIIRIMRDTGVSIEEYSGFEAEPTAEARREQIREQAGGKRLKLLGGVLAGYVRPLAESKSLRKSVNLIPVAVDIVMGYEAIMNRKLSPRERLFYGIAATGAVTSGILLYSGQYKEAILLHAISEAFSKADALPVFLKSASETIGKTSPKFAHMLETMGQSLAQKKEKLSGFQEFMEASLSRLDLENQPAHE